MKKVYNLEANTELVINLGAEYSYLDIYQPGGTDPVYVNTKTVTVGMVGSKIIPAMSISNVFHFDRIQTLNVICASATTLIIGLVKQFTSPIVKNTVAATVAEFNFGSLARTFEIANQGTEDIVYALDRDPVSGTEYTRILKAGMSYTPSKDIECSSIRVLCAGITTVEVVGFPKDDPSQTIMNKRR